MSEVDRLAIWLEAAGMPALAPALRSAWVGGLLNEEDFDQSPLGPCGLCSHAIGEGDPVGEDEDGLYHLSCLEGFQHRVRARAREKKSAGLALTDYEQRLLATEQKEHSA